jgi:hypothetical protein
MVYLHGYPIFSLPVLSVPKIFSRYSNFLNSFFSTVLKNDDNLFTPFYYPVFTMSGYIHGLFLNKLFIKNE